MSNIFDSSCISLYRFENGSLTTDSNGTNTLALYGSPTADTTNYKEGSSSINFDGSTCAYRTDANLSSNFPLRSTDTIKKATFCFWYRYNGVVQYAKAISKWNWNANKRSFGIGPGNTTYYGGIDWGHSSGGNQEWHQFTWKPSDTSRWYHYSVAMDGIGKSIHVRIYGATETNIMLDQWFTPTNELWVGDSEFFIAAEVGYVNKLNAKLDEVAVFNRLLCSDEMDAVASGIYWNSNNYIISSGRNRFQSNGVSLGLMPSGRKSYILSNRNRFQTTGTSLGV